MKQVIAILIIGLLLACNSDSKKEGVLQSTPKKKLVEQEDNKLMKSGDYGTLLTNFSCGMNKSEVARILEVPEGDVGIPNHPIPNKCNFSLKGFGKNSTGDPTHLRWGIVGSSKKRNKTEIKNYLKNKEKYAANPKVYQYMSIALAETKDCYIAQQPSHGRVIIYNENYETIFMLQYGYRGAFKRTQEQQQELKVKMTKLANYLLKKHRT